MHTIIVKYYLGSSTLIHEKSFTGETYKIALERECAYFKDFKRFGLIERKIINGKLL